MPVRSCPFIDHEYEYPYARTHTHTQGVSRAVSRARRESLRESPVQVWLIYLSAMLH